MAASDDRLERIESKVDKIIDHTSSIDVTLARNTDSLVAHMARTEIIEKALFPIKRLYDFGVVAIQILGIIGVSAAILEGVVSLLSYLRE